MIRYFLNFKRPAGTSRGVLRSKETFFLMMEKEGKRGIGECNLFRGLSADDVPEYEAKLRWVEGHLHLGEEALLSELVGFPSIQFGLEQLFKSVSSKEWYHLFPSAFTRGEERIAINGLIWMGTPSYMKEQLREKLSQGFRCIKMKIGAIAFEEEYRLLRLLREEFSASDIEIRVDANGAFGAVEAREILERLASLELHSIEQPIRAGQWEVMGELCACSPLPIALDEELIGVFGIEEKRRLLEVIKPQYIILKPSLVGGYRGSEEWIKLAEAAGIGWWVTSALESNIGLNAIAQWTHTLGNPMPQGLGTGALYNNNIAFPLYVEKGVLGFRASERVAFPFS